MKTISKQDLIEFVKSQDFGYVYGAGFMTVSSEDERELLAAHIEKDGMQILEVEDIENEGCGCSELSEEKENGCTIIKVYNYNIEPLYIAYY